MSSIKETLKGVLCVDVAEYIQNISNLDIYNIRNNFSNVMNEIPSAAMSFFGRQSSKGIYYELLWDGMCNGDGIFGEAMNSYEYEVFMNTEGYRWRNTIITFKQFLKNYICIAHHVFIDDVLEVAAAYPDTFMTQYFLSNYHNFCPLLHTLSPPLESQIKVDFSRTNKWVCYTNPVYAAMRIYR